eukprot:SAG22_NODE_6077_length_904_cov_0.986335_2_plen_81_part_00
MRFEPAGKATTFAEPTISTANPALCQLPGAWRIDYMYMHGLHTTCTCRPAAPLSVRQRDHSVPPTAVAWLAGRPAGQTAR